jgi:hypothetical protein
MGDARHARPVDHKLGRVDVLKIGIHDHAPALFFGGGNVRDAGVITVLQRQIGANQRGIVAHVVIAGRAFHDQGFPGQHGAGPLPVEHLAIFLVVGNCAGAVIRPDDDDFLVGLIVDIVMYLDVKIPCQRALHGMVKRIHDNEWLASFLRFPADALNALAQLVFGALNRWIHSLEWISHHCLLSVLPRISDLPCQKNYDNRLFVLNAT